MLTSPLNVLTGQSRPLAFRLHAQRRISCPSLVLKITFATVDCTPRQLSTEIRHSFAEKDVHDPHRMTFLHPGGIVSYAILRAPSGKVCSSVHSGHHLPILLNLHGAGLEAESHQVRHMLDAMPDIHAWVIYPTGVTSWSSDDWRELE